MKRLAPLAVLLLSTSASASTARIEGLLGNRAFTDDTDVFNYPSVIGDVGDAVNLNYGAAGGIDGGVTWNSQMLWFQRDSVPPASSAPGLGLPFSAVYGQGGDGTGWLARTSWTTGQWNVGGIYATGGQGRETSNFAAGGDVTLTENGNETDVAIQAFARGRDLKSDSHLAWEASAIVVPDVANTLRGGATLGPRWGDGKLRAALSAGPNVTIVNTDAGNALGIDIPAANIAAEYELREWWVVRGSAVAGWQLNVADISKFDDTRAFTAFSGGALGTSFKHDDVAQFDMSVTPAWLTSGPALLSGAANPMFVTVSGRFKI